MKLDDLHGRAEARLRELALPAALDLPDFCAALEQRRGRPLHVVAAATPPGLSGLWHDDGSADYIYYERDTSPLHQQHIILHELAHMLCGHRSAAVSSPEFAQLFLPHLPERVIHQILGRGLHSGRDEQEAEVLASLLLERLAPRTPHALAPDQTDLVDRLHASLGKTSG